MAHTFSVGVSFVLLGVGLVLHGVGLVTLGVSLVHLGVGLVSHGVCLVHCGPIVVSGCVVKSVGSERMDHRRIKTMDTAHNNLVLLELDGIST